MRWRVGHFRSPKGAGPGGWCEDPPGGALTRSSRGTCKRKGETERGKIETKIDRHTVRENEEGRERKTETVKKRKDRKRERQTKKEREKERK